MKRIEGKCIYQGTNSTIYQISDTEVIKFNAGRFDQDIKTQFRYQKNLYENGVRVPEPLEITPIEIVTDLNTEKGTGMIMERIKGKSATSIYWGCKSIAEKVNIELVKANRLGIEPSYMASRNIIIQDNIPYLIDFGNWYDMQGINTTPCQMHWTDLLFNNEVYHQNFSVRLTPVSRVIDIHQ